MKNKKFHIWKNVYLVIISIITLICVGIGVKELVKDAKVGIEMFSGKSYGKKVERTDSFRDFSRIELNVKVANVDIVKKHNISEPSYSFHGNRNLMPKLEVKGDTLKVNQAYDSNLFPSVLKRQNLVIYIPDNYKLENILGTVNNGNCMIDGLDCKKIDVTCNVGNMDASNIKSDELIIKSNIGDIQVSDSKLKSVKAITDTGDVDLEEIYADSYELSSDCGDVEISASELDYEEYSMDINCNTGDIEIAGKDYEGTYRSKEKGNKFFKIKTSVGDVSLEN
ncbi:Putative adhesin [Lachnospiraceae bacterium C7]|nr:Putative adhesin [Lachnospiraceae bacterium C7]